ncbi:MAG: efflux RND transporter periplasmic adaptor subunit [Pseudomonadota bacterium]
MKNKLLSFLVILVVLAGLAGAVWFYGDPSGNAESKGPAVSSPTTVPVEVRAIEKGPIHLRLTFSGALEARAEFVAAPKVGGLVQSLGVDLGDTVKRGQVVARLDSDEAVQTVLQAKADLAVAQANLMEADNSLKIAVREYERIKILKQRGIASDSQYDSATAERMVKESRLEVAKAQVKRAEALLESANIRLGYTRVTADWSGGDENRLVAERYVDEGQTVSANTPLLLISELEPITGIVSVTEKDYASLKPGQSVSLTTDAYPGEVFHGSVDRISPVFNSATRQARVELAISNPDLRLKPGMFIRATVEVRTLTDVTIVPDMAITSRQDQTGVFVVNEKDMTVSWRPVTVGIVENGRAQVQGGEGLSGRVVTLGQQLLDQGSGISIPDLPGPVTNTTPVNSK